MTRLIPLLLGALGALIGLPEESREVSTWVASTAALAGVVAASTAYIRRHVWTTLDGIAVVFVSVGSGVGLAVGLDFGGFLPGTPLIEDVGFGASAGWLASGGIDALRAVFGSKSLPAPEA